MSLWTWLRHAFHADGADVWMQLPDGRPLRWAARLPLPIAFDPSMPDTWWEALYEAVRQLNGAVGREVFMLPVPAGDDMFMRQYAPEPLEGRWPPGGVFVRYSIAPGKPYTQHQDDTRTAVVRAARVTLPSPKFVAPQLRENACLHELGHVLCLGHQAYPSVMAERLESPAQALGAVELGALRGRYR